MGGAPTLAAGKLNYRSKGSVHALDPATGETSWSSTACGVAQTYNWPRVAYANGALYAPSAERLCVLDATTGALRWSFLPGDGPVWFDAPPAIGDGLIYLASTVTAHLYALEAASTGSAESSPAAG